MHLAEAVGFEIYRAAILARLGYVAGRQGEFAVAESSIAQSEALFQALALVSGVLLSLLCYAELHRRQGQLDLAVRLLAHATRRPILFPFDAAISERTLAAARSQLPSAEFATAWAAGQALTLAEALALARPPLIASTVGRQSLYKLAYCVKRSA